MTATSYLQKPGQNGNEIAKFQLSPASITAGSHEEKTFSFKAPPYGVRTKAANEGRSGDRCRERCEGKAHCGPTPQASSGDKSLWIEKTLMHVQRRKRRYPRPKFMVEDCVVKIIRSRVFRHSGDSGLEAAADHPGASARKALRAARRLLHWKRAFCDDKQTIADAHKATKTPDFSRGHQAPSVSAPDIGFFDSAAYWMPYRQAILMPTTMSAILRRCRTSALVCRRGIYN
jgi:hypothetical protein